MSSSGRSADNAGGSRLARLGPALEVRDFRHLWGAALGWDIGEQMILLAIGWQVYDYHHKALYLGLIGLAEFIPMLLLALPLGTVADRSSRRALLTAAILIDVGVAGGLAVLSATGVTLLWPFLALAMVAGVAMALGSPASRSLPPMLVPTGLVESAVTLRGASMYASTILGPAAAGLLLVISPVVTYSVSGAVMLVGAALAWTMHFREAPGRLGTTGGSGRDLFAGLHFIRGTQVIFGAILLDLVAVLFGGAVALLPLYAASILHLGTVGLGILRSSASVGALIAAVVITRTEIGERAGKKMLLAVGAFGVAVVVFGLSRSFPLSIVALAAAGFADMYSVNIRGTAIALATPDSLRGRVTAVEMVFISGSNELGAFESGLAAALIGAVPAVVAGGALTIFFAAIWPRWFPGLARVNRLTDLAPEGEERAA